MSEILEDIEYVDPNPASIIESLRSIGYTLETAIADLIDNSITANANAIDIYSPFNGTNTKIFILDDGIGMSESTLIEAMRLGTNGPSVKRSKKDLGRFGLGLKTATFSQCKRLLLFYLLILRGGSRLPNLCILVCQALIKWRGVEVTVALEVTLYYDYMVTRFILDILRGDENDNMLLPMLCNLFISHRDITFYIAGINNILCF